MQIVFSMPLFSEKEKKINFSKFLQASVNIEEFIFGFQKNLTGPKFRRIPRKWLAMNGEPCDVIARRDVMSGTTMTRAIQLRKCERRHALDGFGSEGALHFYGI